MSPYRYRETGVGVPGDSPRTIASGDKSAITDASDKDDSSCVGEDIKMAKSPSRWYCAYMQALDWGVMGVLHPIM